MGSLGEWVSEPNGIEKGEAYRKCGGREVVCTGGEYGWGAESFLCGGEVWSFCEEWGGFV